MGTNILTKIFYENSFYENYKSLVVLSNSKKVLKVKYASKDIKEKNVCADQLIQKIKRTDEKLDVAEFNQKTMLEIANLILEKNIEVRFDFAKKHKELLQKLKNDAEHVEETNCEELVKRLKAFRLEHSEKKN